MVKTVTLGREGKGGTYYMCEECGLVYSELRIAERCEEWCRNHKSCNLEITRNAVRFED